MLPSKSIESKILMIRGVRVMLDRDLAVLYQVKAIALRQQVKRNRKRFPEDFMFQLTKGEAEYLVSQNVIPSKKSLGGYQPYAFTEQGVAMLSSVLNSDRAIMVNMRTFTKLRVMLSSHVELKGKIEYMERRYDRQFKIVFDAIKKLITPPDKPRRKIGFINKEK